MQTRADERLSSAVRNITAAVEDLSAIVIDRCEGWSEFRAEWQTKIRTALNELLSMRESLEL